MPEMIDHVDSGNQIIGQTTKAESHRLGYPHRVAAIFVFNQAGELLMNQRADNGLWDHSVGGHIRSGEDEHVAAQREGWEEIGLPMSQTLTAVGTFLVEEVSGHELLRHWFSLYCIRADHFEPKIDAREVRHVAWRSVDWIRRSMREYPDRFTGGFRGTMEYYLRHMPAGPWSAR